MSDRKDIRHSILIVSSSEQFDLTVKRSLQSFITIDIRKSASSARNCVLERNYDIVVINSPLPDEAGADLAIDIAERSSSSVLLVTPQEVYEDVLNFVTDYGILVVPKPYPNGRIDRAIRYLVAVQNRMYDIQRKNESLEDKMEELRIVSKAKIILVQKKKLSEDEAHKFIGKIAMNNGVSRRIAAERILDDLI